MAKDHGSSIKNDKQCEGLRKKGMTKSRRGGDLERRGLLSKGGKRSQRRLEPESQEQRLGSGGNRAQKQAAGHKGGKASS